jgi:hypothetical protein
MCMWISICFILVVTEAAKAELGTQLKALDKLWVKPEADGAWSTRMEAGLKDKCKATNKLQHFSFIHFWLLFCVGIFLSCVRNNICDNTC